MSLLSPSALNAVRLANDSWLAANFVATLLPLGSTTSVCQPTPTDVQGPFHLPPEQVPTEFPARSAACVSDPSCVGCNSYSGGIPLLLSGYVRSAVGNCAPLTGDGVIVDIWQADPTGTYWDNNGHWRRGLQEQHLYNCRAHQAGGTFNFTTMLPGYYVAGTSWRPRHIHIRIQATGHRTVISQVSHQLSLHVSSLTSY